MKEFTTALKAAVEDETEEPTWLTWMLDGVECHCYRPTEPQIAIIMADLGRHSQLSTQISGIIDFFVGILDDRTHRHIVGRLLDRNDPYGIEEIRELMEWIIEEWTGNPSGRRSGSTGSPSPTGPRSTQQRTG